MENNKTFHIQYVNENSKENGNIIIYYVLKIFIMKIS